MEWNTKWYRDAADDVAAKLQARRVEFIAAVQTIARSTAQDRTPLGQDEVLSDLYDALYRIARAAERYL